MAGITISIDHKVGQNEALNKIKKILDGASKQFSGEISDLRVVWNGPASDFSFKVANVLINGNLAVYNDSIAITSKIPFAFLLFKGQIEKIVRQHADGILK